MYRVLTERQDVLAEGIGGTEAFHPEGVGLTVSEWNHKGPDLKCWD